MEENERMMVAMKGERATLLAMMWSFNNLQTQMRPCGDTQVAPSHPRQLLSGFKNPTFFLGSPLYM
jgi:hypothetical protein